MTTTIGMKIFLLILFVQIVKNDIDVKNESSCVNDECTIVGIDLLGETSQPTTVTEVSDFTTEEEEVQKTKIEDDKQKSGNEPKLVASNDGLEDKFHIVKLPNPAVLIIPEKATNKSSNTNANASSLSKKEQNVNEDQSSAEKAQKGTGGEAEKPAVETTTQLNMNITKDLKNGTNTTKEIHHKHHYKGRNQSEICTCDLTVRQCDINCCCDRDCSANMKAVFTECVDAVDKVSPQFCFNSRSIFKNNLQTNTNYNGLLCVVRTNFHPNLQFTDEMIIHNVTKFNKMMSRKKIFTYTPIRLDNYEMKNFPYRVGDYVWTFSENKTFPFGVPKQTIDLQCNSKRNIHYLTDYETQCLRFVPRSREKCMKASELGMDYYLRDIQVIRSPALVTLTNSSDKICHNKSCVPVTPYICPEDTEMSSCVQTTPRRLFWDNICKNIVLSVEYRVYHNGTDGIKEVRAYFILRALQKESFVQKIHFKFLWVKARSEVFKRSGNPGYIIGKPVMSGRKVYSSNETMSSRKEAIELSYNPEDWLTVFGSNSGACSPAVRRPIGFGENALYTCSVDLEEFDYMRRKCVGLQDGLFNLLLGDDFADVKLNGKLNKFVATFGNSGVEDTGDWVQVIVDVLPMVSSQVTFSSHSGFVTCKNVISDLFIDVAYSKIGSFDRPQNKIIGVHMYFGSPKDFFYYIKPNASGYGYDQYLKLSTFIHFIDMSPEPQAEFAETPGFEAKLPHDFFYPFFSGCSIPSGNFVLTLFLYSLVVI